MSIRKSSRFGKVLGRPSWVSVPSFMVWLTFGQMADEILLASQRVVPKQLIEAGFQFTYQNVKDIMNDVVERD